MPDTHPPRLIVDGRNVFTTETFARPVAERPVQETVRGISDWLISTARRNTSFVQVIDEFGWRLLAAGLPLLRVSLHGGTLHPQFLGATYVWWRDDALTQKIMISHEVVDLVPYPQNVVRRVREGGETLRRRLETDDGIEHEISVLNDMKARGATDYLALPIPSPFGFGAYMLAYVSDRPGGFADTEIDQLRFLSGRLSVIADMNSQRQIAENVLSAYLGPRTGPRVLAGEIRRGSGAAISAVLWSSDMRDFTHLSDHMPGERVIALLNEIFDLQAKAIARHGGEILKFIGDGLLAIFPAPTPQDAAHAAASALAAARETLAARAVRISPDGEPPLRIVIALHYGAVIYGNIGAADRLDFTVIGPAVNLVSRIETVAKSLDLPLVVSDDFVEAHGEASATIGLHRLRGLERPHELFAPTIGVPG
jgi:adenylate cyclase